MNQDRQPLPKSVLENTGKTPIKVDDQTFDALQLAQAAIHYVHASTPYGAPNQVSQIYTARDGSRTNAEAVTRFIESMATFFELRGLSAKTAFGTTSESIGIMAGLTLLSETGNCQYQAALAFAYFAKNAPPGIKLELIEFNAVIEPSIPNSGGVFQCLNHFCVRISWCDCENEVICDPWPTCAEACRQSEYFGTSFNQHSALTAKHGHPLRNPEVRVRLSTPWDILNTYIVTSQNQGRDLVQTAFAAFGPTLLPSFSELVPPSEAELIDFDRSFGIGHRVSALADHLSPDLHYSNSRRSINRNGPFPGGPRLPADIVSELETSKQGPLPGQILASGFPLSAVKAENSGNRKPETKARRRKR